MPEVVALESQLSLEAHGEDLLGEERDDPVQVAQQDMAGCDESVSHRSRTNSNTFHVHFKSLSHFQCIPA